MASLHRRAGSPYWYAAFYLPDGRRTFRSTGTTNKRQAWNICLKFEEAARLAKQDRLTEASEQRGWITFGEPRPHDMFSLLLAADSFPPAILSSQGMLAWVPTIELSVNVRNIPVSSWLKCVFRTRFINCGLLEEDGELWDEAGELIGISRQIAQFRKVA